ncbi:hypothetical protein [Aliikangiella sp. IMCC44632]
MKNLSDSYLFGYTCLLAVLACWLLNQFLDFSLINSIIVVHVLLGSIAFLVGGITLFSKKGGRVHKTSGKIFYISMVVSVALTLLVSVSPNHISPSLFQIGVLSLYFLIGGKRSIGLKQPNPRLFIDRSLATIVICVSLFIMAYSVVLDGSFNPLRTVFGSIGIAFGVFDLILFKQPQTIKRKWLVLHLSKMLGGYTAAVTAFFVAQQILTGYYDWFMPSVFGLSYILFWLLKLKAFKLARMS